MPVGAAGAAAGPVGAAGAAAGLVAVAAGAAVAAAAGRAARAACSGGAGTPLVPDSVASSGPVQSGSARSLMPSPSSSARFEHWGRTSTSGEVAAVGDVDLDAALADADDAAAAGARGPRDHAGAEDREADRE